MNKYMFSYLRTLTAWHCPHTAAAAIDKYLLLAGPAASKAGLLL